MSGLQDKANPVYGLTSVLAYELSELRKEQVNTNKLLKDICDYKEEQKQGDITYRKKSTKHSRWAISIALLAVYVSIFGADSSFVMWLRSLS